ncbi:hypothetical protein B0T16DRAFT_315009 [Cercophora newfieldiana]|uniref:JmjC domain-containing protein n=1 Tax=Cercophora newfieldiana TaxID=92897 RepID=A0AA39YPH5_9PEZI|nr:hypothetical protein B0T16DRAFT_315009 [Cercophora newfieldiana]
MDALQGRVDLIEGELRQIGDTLRGYLDSGQTPARKVKPPGTKAGRELLQHLLGRLEQVSTQVGGLPKWTSGLTPLPTGPDTPLSYGSPAAQQSEGSPSQLRDTPRDTLPSPSPAAALPRPQLQPNRVASPAEPDEPITTTPGLSGPPAVAPPRNGGSSTPLLQAAPPLLSDHASPLFTCTYRDINELHEELFEEFSRHPVVRDRGYFKLDVQDLPILNVEKMARPTKDHATSFCYKVDSRGLIKVDTGKRVKFSTPRLPFPRSAQAKWSFEEQKKLWNSTADNPPKGTQPYIIGNPLFDDVELSPGKKLLSRGKTVLEGINTQYVYFNLTGKTITTMHREDAHVRSENLLRSGANKFWCFVKPSSTAKMEEELRRLYPNMRFCSQSIRHLSLHIPPSKLDEWGVEYTLDYCVPGQAIVTEPGTYHQVLNAGPNYAVAINVEYLSSPDFPINYTFCDDNCPDKFAMSPEDFLIYPKPRPGAEPGNKELRDREETEDVEPRPSEEHPKASSNQNSPVPSPFDQEFFPTPKQNPGLYRLGGGHSPKTIPAPVFRPPRQASPPPDQVAQAAAALASMPNGSPAPAPPSAAPTVLPQASPAVPTQVTQIIPAAVSPVPVPVLPPAPKSKKRPAGAAPAKKATKKQRTEVVPAVVPATSPAPASSTATVTSPAIASAAAAYKSLAMMVQGGGKTKAETLTAGLVDSPASRKAAFQRLDQLVRAWRMITISSIFSEGKFYDFINKVDEMAHFTTPIHIFLRRLIRMKMAGLVYNIGDTEEERRLGTIGGITSLLEKLGWTENDRGKLQHYIREGKCWRTICNNDDGMLCIMPLNTDLSDLAMFQEEVTRFHSQLSNGFTAALANIGRQLVSAIWEGRELSEFVWENYDTDALSPTEIQPLLRPYITISSGRSFYDAKGQSNAPRPTNWSDAYPWPTDPAVVRDGARHCDFCKRKKSCQCCKKRMPDIPRVEIDGPKGLGIRSRGEHKAGELLGELLGELVAPGSYPTEWTFELRRPDMEDELVAEIYPGRRGNWVRKVNHSEEPTAQFTAFKMSGRWRILLELLSDVKEGEEITAKFGRGYVKGSELTAGSLD